MINPNVLKKIKKENPGIGEKRARKLAQKTPTHKDHIYKSTLRYALDRQPKAKTIEELVTPSNRKELEAEAAIKAKTPNGKDAFGRDTYPSYRKLLKELLANELVEEVIETVPVYPNNRSTNRRSSTGRFIHNQAKQIAKTKTKAVEARFPAVHPQVLAEVWERNYTKTVMSLTGMPTRADIANQK